MAALTHPHTLKKMEEERREEEMCPI